MKFTSATLCTVLALATVDPVEGFSKTCMPQSRVHTALFSSWFGGGNNNRNRNGYNENPMDAYTRAMREINNGFSVSDNDRMSNNYLNDGKFQPQLSYAPLNGMQQQGVDSPEVSPLLPDQDDRAQRTSSIFPPSNRVTGQRDVIGNQLYDGSQRPQYYFDPSLYETPRGRGMMRNSYQQQQQQPKTRLNIFGQRVEAKQQPQPQQSNNNNNPFAQRAQSSSTLTYFPPGDQANGRVAYNDVNGNQLNRQSYGIGTNRDNINKRNNNNQSNNNLSVLPTDQERNRRVTNPFSSNNNFPSDNDNLRRINGQTVQARNRAINVNRNMLNGYTSYTSGTNNGLAGYRGGNNGYAQNNNNNNNVNGLNLEPANNRRVPLEPANNRRVTTDTNYRNNNVADSNYRNNNVRNTNSYDNNNSNNRSSSSNTYNPFKARNGRTNNLNNNNVNNNQYGNLNNDPLKLEAADNSNRRINAIGQRPKTTNGLSSNRQRGYLPTSGMGNVVANGARAINGMDSVQNNALRPNNPLNVEGYTSSTPTLGQPIQLERYNRNNNNGMSSGMINNNNNNRVGSSLNNNNNRMGGRVNNNRNNSNINNNDPLRLDNSNNGRAIYTSKSRDELKQMNGMQQQQQYYSNDAANSIYSTPSSRRAVREGLMTPEEVEYERRLIREEQRRKNGNNGAAAALFIGAPLAALVGPQYIDNLSPQQQAQVPKSVMDFSKQVRKNIENMPQTFSTSGALKEQVKKNKNPEYDFSTTNQKLPQKANEAPKPAPVAPAPPPAPAAVASTTQVTSEQILRELDAVKPPPAPQAPPAAAPKAEVPPPKPAEPKITEADILKQLEDVKVSYQDDSTQQQYVEAYNSYNGGAISQQQSADANNQYWAAGGDNTQQRQYQADHTTGYEAQQQYVDGYTDPAQQQYQDAYSSFATGDQTQQQYVDGTNGFPTTTLATGDQAQQQYVDGSSAYTTDFETGDQTQQQQQQQHVDGNNGYATSGDAPQAYQNYEHRYQEGYNGYDDYSMF